jgi:hypothetical protein
MSYEKFWLPDDPGLWEKPIVDKENGIVIERARPGDGHIFVDLQCTVMEEDYPIRDNPEAVERYNVTKKTMHEFVGSLRERKDALYWDKLLDAGEQEGWLAKTDDKERMAVGLSIGAPRIDIELPNDKANSAEDALYSVREI